MLAGGTATRLFDFKLKDGEAPADARVLDANGNIDETKLQQQSDKNAKKKPNQ